MWDYSSKKLAEVGGEMQRRTLLAGRGPALAGLGLRRAHGSFLRRLSDVRPVESGASSAGLPGGDVLGAQIGTKRYQELARPGPFSRGLPSGINCRRRT